MSKVRKASDKKSIIFLVRHLLESIWDSCQVPVTKNSKSKIKPESKNPIRNPAEIPIVEKKKEPIKLNGACVQISGLSKTVTKKSLVHEILKGYKITNYGLYMETEKGICTGKEGFIESLITVTTLVIRPLLRELDLTNGSVMSNLFQKKSVMQQSKP